MPVDKCEECMKDHVKSDDDKLYVKMCFHRYLEIRNKFPKMKNPKQQHFSKKQSDPNTESPPE